jgi:predicted MFS family arabinose efflux permease
MTTVEKESPVGEALGRPFYQLWIASAVSNLGDGVGLTAAPLFAATLTRDPVLVAGLAISQRLPWVLFSLVSGAVVDRIDRRRIMVWANLLRVVALLLLGGAILLHQATLPLLYVVFFMIGTAETFFDNASIAFLPNLVPESGLERANGRLFATQTLANEFLGPPLGGYLFSWLIAIPFLFNATGFALAMILIALIQGQFRAIPDSVPNQSLSLGDSIKEGVQWFWNHRLLRTFGLMVGVTNFFYSAIFSVFVLYAQNRLGLDAVQYGLLLTSGAVGGVIGALVAENLARRVGAGWAIFICNILPAIAFTGIALTTNALIVGFLFACNSFAGMMANVILVSFRQSVVPAPLLGRVTSAYRLFVMGALPTGAFVGGLLTQYFGLTAPYWVGGLSMVFVAFAVLPIANNQTIALARQKETMV